MALSIEPMFEVKDSSVGVLGRIHHQSTAHKMRRDLPRTADNHKDCAAEFEVVQIAEVTQPPHGGVEVREVVRELQDPVVFELSRM